MFDEKSGTFISIYLNNGSQRSKCASHFSDSEYIFSGVSQFKTNTEYQNSRKSSFKSK